MRITWIFNSFSRSEFVGNSIRRMATTFAANSSTAKSSPLIRPPESVRGMTELEKEKFATALTVPTLHIQTVTLSKVMRHVKKYLLKLMRFKSIKATDNDGEMCLMMNPSLISTWNDLHDSDRQELETLNITANNLKQRELIVTYENFLPQDILRAVLPQDIETVSSFSQVGHIIHLNLREHLLPYKRLIAQVFAEKIPNVRTVVNKIDAIDNTYRNFEMEVLYGEADFLVDIKQNHCSFRFDFGTVYWNPRLSTEHERIVEMLTKNDVLFDVFAGVGPFSIPAAKKGCTVYANDLNPESYKWLKYNVEKNKIDSSRIHIYNEDGRDFITKCIKDNLINHLGRAQVYITMNLPALAITFVDLLFEMYEKGQLPEEFHSPIVHVYCFAKGEDYMAVTKKLISSSVSRDIQDRIIDIVKVRTVSNFKEMMRISFKLDAELLVRNCKRKYEEVDHEG